MRKSYVYIMASRPGGVLYIGVTNNLENRVKTHRSKVPGSFTERYLVYHLVYYEEFTSIVAAITREKHLKKWRRQWKIDLIRSLNPKWKDLFEEGGFEEV